MSTYAHFFIAGPLRGIWLGILQRDSRPAEVAAVGPRRLALTATDADTDTCRDAVEDLLTAWEDDGRGAAIRPRRYDDAPPYDADYVYSFNRERV